ncbi:hypothetical protein L0Z64_15265 [Phaeobacter sp. BS23]|uniref:hypothetical protein n=1 Tax=Phaeobacter sp. BS23 TaxID=2907239 RepID=UPI0038685A45
MKDVMTGPEAPGSCAQKLEWDDPFAMTQQGFKRFRRRKGRDPSAPEHDSALPERADSGSPTSRSSETSARDMAASSAKATARLSQDGERNRFARRPKTGKSQPIEGLADTDPQPQRLLAAPA